MNYSYKDRETTQLIERNKNESISDIARSLGVSRQAIHDRFKRAGHTTIRKESKKARARRVRLENNPHLDRNYLKEKYVTEDLTANRIAVLTGQRLRTIQANLQRFGIKKKG